MNSQISIQLSDQVKTGISVGAECQPHFHTQTEILFNLGTDIKVIESKSEYVLTKGDILFVESMTAHSVYSQGDGDYNIFVIELMPSFFMPYENILVKRRFVDPLVNGSKPVASRFFGEILNAMYREFLADLPEKEMFLRSLGSMLVAGIIRYLSTEVLTASVGCEKIAKVLDMISNTPLRDITADRAARFAELSCSRFMHLFKDTTGITFGNYVEKIRTAQAKELLLRKDVSIGEIVSLCGFKCEGQFSRAFKRQFGISPATYKNTVVG